MSDIPNWVAAAIGLVPTVALAFIIWGKRSSDIDAIVKAVQGQREEHDEFKNKCETDRTLVDGRIRILENDFIRYTAKATEQYKQILENQRIQGSSIQNLTRQMGNVATLAGARVFEIPTTRRDDDDDSNTG